MAHRLFISFKKKNTQFFLRVIIAVNRKKGKREIGCQGLMSSAEYGINKNEKQAKENLNTFGST